jgi:hypothetical protein
MTTAEPAHLPKKHRLVWTTDRTTALLTQIVADKPHLAAHSSIMDAWGSVAGRLESLAIFNGHEVRADTCQKHFKEMLSKFHGKDRAAKSGAYSSDDEQSDTERACASPGFPLQHEQLLRDIAQEISERDSQRDRSAKKKRERLEKFAQQDETVENATSTTHRKRKRDMDENDDK